MTIMHAQVPDEAFQAVRDVVDWLGAHGALSTPALRRADPAAIGYSRPHQVALLLAETLRAPQQRARIIGWRFLLSIGDAAPVAAGQADWEGSGYGFGMLNEGPLVSGMVTALSRAQQVGGRRDKTWETLLLLAPGLNAAALWLRAVGSLPEVLGDDDLFLPLPPVSPGLEAYAPLHKASFVGALSHVADQIPAGNVRGG